MEREILSTRKYKAGYEIRTELVTMEGNPDTELKSAYTPDGHYIGNSKSAHRLIVKRGIKPELADEKHSVCSIGFSEKEQKWYGWSHRAIYGFGIGDVAKEGDCCTEPGVIPEYLAEHPEADLSVPVGFEALTLEDAKRMAIAFAEFGELMPDTEKLFDRVFAVDGLDGWMMISKIPFSVVRRCDICKKPFADIQVIDDKLNKAAFHWSCVDKKELKQESK